MNFDLIFMDREEDPGLFRPLDEELDVAVRRLAEVMA